MSKYTVKFLKDNIKTYEQEVREDKDRIQKAILQIGLLTKQMKKAPKEFWYIYKDSILELKRDEVLHFRAEVRENTKVVKDYKKLLPAAIKYEKDHPERAHDSTSDRKRKFHLDKIRAKAKLASKAKNLAKRIMKATGLHATAFESYDKGGEYTVVVHNRVKLLNDAKKKVPELAKAKVTDTYKDGTNGMRGSIRVVVK